jgi:hypothetical protein
MILKPPKSFLKGSPMDVKPSKGLKVKISATREAVFGEEGVEVKKISGKTSGGTLTGRTLVGYAEAEMKDLDGKNHWYPVDQMITEAGEKVVEEEIVIEVPEDTEDEEEQEE